MMKFVRKGVAGQAQLVTAPKTKPDHMATIEQWFVDAPGQSPSWRHYMIGLIHLRLIPGVPDPIKFHPKAEYEIICFALDPWLNPNPNDSGTWRAMHPMNAIVQFALNHQHAEHGHYLDDDDMAIEVARDVMDEALQGRIALEPLLGGDPRCSKHNAIWALRIAQHRLVRISFDMNATYMGG